MTSNEPENKPQEQPQQPESPGLNLEDDTPLAPACNLSGDGTCEACQ